MHYVIKNVFHPIFFLISMHYMIYCYIGEKMKINQLIVRIDEELQKYINDTLESLPRFKYPNKSTLLREAIQLGLMQIKQGDK